MKTCKYAGICKYASMQVCMYNIWKYASKQECKNASMCKYVSMQIFKFTSNPVWNVANMQVCKYASMQECKYVSVQVYASMQVCKYWLCKFTSILVCM